MCVCVCNYIFCHQHGAVSIPRVMRGTQVPSYFPLKISKLCLNMVHTPLKCLSDRETW